MTHQNHSLWVLNCCILICYCITNTFAIWRQMKQRHLYVPDLIRWLRNWEYSSGYGTWWHELCPSFQVIPYNKKLGSEPFFLLLKGIDFFGNNTRGFVFSYVGIFCKLVAHGLGHWGNLYCHKFWQCHTRVYDTLLKKCSKMNL